MEDSSEPLGRGDALLFRSLAGHGDLPISGAPRPGLRHQGVGQQDEQANRTSNGKDEEVLGLCHGQEGLHDLHEVPSDSEWSGAFEANQGHAHTLNDILVFCTSRSQKIVALSSCVNQNFML